MKIHGFEEGLVWWKAMKTLEAASGEAPGSGVGS